MTEKTASSTFRIRSMGLGLRLGLTCLLLTILGGLVAAAAQINEHHKNRDDQPGLSMTDIVGAYHGIDQPSRLVTSLSSGHPETLAEPQRQALLTWLSGTRISEEYDNLDLGDRAPSEIIAQNCLSCHARNSSEGSGIGQTSPLEYWDDVKKLAFSRQISPPPESILILTTHTHALSIGVIGILLTLLLHWSRWPKSVTNVVGLLIGAGLLADIACWWLARTYVSLVYVIVVAGGVYMGFSMLACVILVADLWLPRGREA